MSFAFYQFLKTDILLTFPNVDMFSRVFLFAVCDPYCFDSQCELNPTPSTSSALERWEDKHVRLLIGSYMKFKDEFGKSSKKKIFEKIAQEFNLHSDLIVTVDQCLRKWKKLESKQKEVEDNNSKTGRAKKTWKYYQEMEECVGENPNVKPVFIYEASSSSSMSGCSSQVNENLSSSDSEDGEGDGTNSKGKSQQKRVTRKRKSRSSAAEMIEFLKDYSTKREKVEEEKINILKSMQQEKKQFFADYFSYLKDSKK